MKLYKIEFDETTTFIGTIEAETLEKAKEIIHTNCFKSLTNIDPVIGETIIQHIEEV